MCLFYFGGFPRNPVYRPIVCQLSGGERVNHPIYKITILKQQALKLAYVYHDSLNNRDDHQNISKNPLLPSQS